MARFRRAGEDADGLELALDGNAVVERTAFGEARRQTHDRRAARIAYYQRTIELLDDRWRRTTAFVDDLVIDEEPALAQAIDSGDLEALAVYTDWLLERGDPRGELAALRRAPQPDLKAIRSLEKTRGIELFGPLAFVPRSWRLQYAFTWAHGWVDGVTFRYVEPDRGVLPPGVELVRHVMHAPMARFARHVDIDAWFALPIWECLADTDCLSRIRSARIEVPASRVDMLRTFTSLERVELVFDSREAMRGLAKALAETPVREVILETSEIPSDELLELKKLADRFAVFEIRPRPA